MTDTPSSPGGFTPPKVSKRWMNVTRPNCRLPLLAVERSSSQSIAVGSCAGTRLTTAAFTELRSSAHVGPAKWMPITSSMWSGSSRSASG